MRTFAGDGTSCEGRQDVTMCACRPGENCGRGPPSSHAGSRQRPRPDGLTAAGLGVDTDAAVGNGALCGRAICPAQASPLCGCRRKRSGKYRIRSRASSVWARAIRGRRARAQDALPARTRSQARRGPQKAITELLESLGVGRVLAALDPRDRRGRRAHPAASSACVKPNPPRRMITIRASSSYGARRVEPVQ